MKFINQIIQDLRSKQNLDGYITALVAIVMAVLGIIGVINQAIVSAAILAVLTLVTIWLMENRHEDDNIRLSISNTDDIRKQVTTLLSSMGTSVSYVPIHLGEYNLVMKSLRKLVSQTSQELLVLDYIPVDESKRSEFKHTHEDISLVERKQYYDEITSKILQSNDKHAFRYRRIFQLPKDRRLVEILANDPILREHCEKVVKLGDKRPELTSLKFCNILYRGTVIISDRKTLVLGMDIIDPDDQNYYDYGYFVFDDVQQNVIQHFLRYFERADAKATLVRNDDLK